MFKSSILKPEIIFFEIKKNEISGDMNWSLIKKVTIVKKSVLSLMIYGFNIMEIKIQADFKKMKLMPDSQVYRDMQRI